MPDDVCEVLAVVVCEDVTVEVTVVVADADCVLLRKAGIRALLDILKLVLDVKDKMLVATLATTASTWHRPGKETQGGQGA